MSEAPHNVTGFDWAAIKRHLQKSVDDLGRTVAPTDATAKAVILKARARALALEPLQFAEQSNGCCDVIEFMLAYERYAVEVALVREVHPLKEITTLPGTPAFVAGIVNVRGQIVSVIDMKRLFELPDRGLTDLNKVIVLRDERMEFGLLVDAVLGVRRLSPDDLQPPLATFTGARASYVRGVTQHRMSVLDARRMLADPAIVVCADTRA